MWGEGLTLKNLCPALLCFLSSLLNWSDVRKPWRTGEALMWKGPGALNYLVKEALTFTPRALPCWRQAQNLYNE